MNAENNMTIDVKDLKKYEGWLRGLMDNPKAKAGYDNAVLARVCPKCGAKFRADSDLAHCPICGYKPKEDGRYMEIVIYGEPVPQGRPKFASFGGHVHAYDPAKSKNYKQLVRFWVTQYLKKLDGFTPYENALCVDLTFYLGIPTSWSKQKRIQASQGQIRPIVRNGDIDNMVKAILDANNGLLWVDDAIITDLSARKRYTEDLARVVLKVTEH